MDYFLSISVGLPKSPQIVFSEYFRGVPYFAQWSGCAECKSFRMFFGCDLPSVDLSGSKEKPIHNLLLNKGIIIYESLTNLNKLPINEKFKFYQTKAY